MNSPNNLVLKRHLQIIFYLSFFLFLYFYFKYSFPYYLTKYCFLNCLMTGTSFLVRDSKRYKEKKHS
ncbi:hypothetical protein SAMN04487777_109146 [Priestia aryabhattai B8W22]|nr:hypothetical protein SAMN04487777_109146 [Priestia aryabhattai B8W22]